MGGRIHPRDKILELCILAYTSTLLIRAVTFETFSQRLLFCGNAAQPKEESTAFS